MCHAQSSVTGEMGKRRRGKQVTKRANLHLGVSFVVVETREQQNSTGERSTVRQSESNKNVMAVVTTCFHSPSLSLFSSSILLFFFFFSFTVIVVSISVVFIIITIVFSIFITAAIKNRSLLTVVSGGVFPKRFVMI